MEKVHHKYLVALIYTSKVHQLACDINWNGLQGNMTNLLLDLNEQQFLCESLKMCILTDYPIGFCQE